ncbi:MAG: hypothetical protein KAY37_04225, partial [Phycisphaerae bacterium]|nr:hypothetical protein [Phycisphaerae bacterium]
GGNIDVNEAQTRAAIRKARNIRVYAEAEPARSSFHISPIIAGDRPPQPLDIWYAQVGLWIQTDVVNAIRKLNEEAAAELDEGKAHVANMPVKRLVDVQVFGYVTSKGQPVSFERVIKGGSSSGSAPPSFTGRLSDEQFDVVRFAVIVIVDQRDLLKLVDRVIRENFYQLVGLQYTAVSRVKDDGLYFYGEAPTVKATLNFEGYMSRKVYEAMMPPKVREALGIDSGEK